MTLEKINPKIEKKAIEILKGDDIMKYIIDVAHIFHKSDDDIFRLAILSAIQHKISNFDRGLYINVTGSPGKGKSDSLDILSDLLPEEWTLITSLTPKTLFYASENGSLDEVKIIFSDDISFNNEDLVETLKKITSKFSKGINHTTTIKQTSVTLKIPAKKTFWFTSVASLPDTQLASRFINISVDESPTTDDEVARLMTKNAFDSNTIRDNYFNVKVCKCIFSKLCENEYGIISPYYEAIKYNNPNDRRLIASFLSILKCVTFLNHFKREITKDNNIISEVEDFEIAVSILSSIYKTHKSKLSKPELEIYNVIEANNDKMTLSQIQKIVKRSEGSIRTNLMSLLEKVPNLSSESQTVQEINKGGKQVNKTSKYYFITNESQFDPNEYMPKGKLADIYIDSTIYDRVVSQFWETIDR